MVNNRHTHERTKNSSCTYTGTSLMEGRKTLEKLWNLRYHLSGNTTRSMKLIPKVALNSGMHFTTLHLATKSVVHA